uniref:Uncharacterized protein n=1 Tax=uncultured marine virus TaxID=186617 RepID=A0A0F7L6K4_9VIRU|nr:hypothetical protein [uncultured marine virus]
MSTLFAPARTRRIRRSDSTGCASSPRHDGQYNLGGCFDLDRLFFFFVMRHAMLAGITIVRVIAITIYAIATTGIAARLRACANAPLQRTRNGSITGGLYPLSARVRFKTLSLLFGEV